MAEYSYSIMPIMLFLLLIKICSSHTNCDESSCGSNQPLIRFPFQLRNARQDNQTCRLRPEFCLYCTKTKQTMIVLPTTSGPTNFLVDYINYENQRIDISDPENCIGMKFLKINSSSFVPFRWPPNSVADSIFFFNCSTVSHRLRNRAKADPESCPIYLSYNYDSVLELDLVSCTKMLDYVDAASFSLVDLEINFLSLSWDKPNCTKCEAKGERCRLKNNNGIDGDTECFAFHCSGKHKKIHIPKSFIFAAAGSILFGLVTVAVSMIYLNFKKKEEDQTRVNKFLEDYRAQKPARFSYADIKRITNGFKEKLGEGAHGTIFKGKLSNEISIAVKILNNTEQEEGKEFINEVEIMGKIHHINVVRLLGFCAEGIHRALVYNFFPDGSLQSFIFPPDNKNHFLGWDKLQQIALGIAKGIEYLHEGCNHPILHFDIKPHNVLLDNNFTPKISDFGLAKSCSKNLSAVSMTAARGTLGYMAPEVFSRNFGNVSLKSDIYSFGMLLLEMVGGRKNIDMSSTETFEVLYPEWIHNLLEGDVHICIEEEYDVKIAKKLATIGLWCIQWQPVNRPSIKMVVQMLETRDENQLNVPPNPFHSTTSATTEEHAFVRQPFHMEVIHE